MSWLELLRGARRKSRSGEGDREAQDVRLGRRYRNLRELLAANNDALELISELESDLLLFPAGDPQIRARVAALLDRCEELVASLERLDERRYQELSMVLAAVRKEVGRALDTSERACAGALVLPLADLSRDDSARVGGKAANLAAIRNAGLPVPYGFVLTTAAYWLFVRECGLVERVRHELAGLDPEDLEALDRASHALRSHVLEAPMPPAIEDAIRSGIRRLLRRAAEGLAVRSSASGEDAVLTFAGQFDSQINVPEEELVSAYRKVVASRFNARAIYYRQTAGIAEVDSPMAVLFVRMIDAQASGVVYTRDPTRPKAKTLLVNSTWGACFTDGNVGDRWWLSRGRSPQIVERHLAAKQSRLVLAESGLEEEPVPAPAVEAQSIDDSELEDLAKLALRAEELFGCPQDIEWAIDASGSIWWLQRRPLRFGAPAQNQRPRAAKADAIVSAGVTIYPGQVSGPAFRADSAENLAKVQNGSILVLDNTSPDCVRVLTRIGGLVVEFGNPAGHAAALVREFRVPTIFDGGQDCHLIKQGEIVSLDAGARRVYRGAIFPSAKSRLERAKCRLADTKHPLADRITSLSLLDPKAWSFRASSCRSLHDVVRFAHERAIQAMFQVGDSEVEVRSPSIKLLDSELPLVFYVLDLGGGIAPEARNAKRVRPDDICSIPFRALWRGMSHPGIAWTGREYVSISGFASVLAHAITNPVDEGRELGSTSYVAIADNYVNFNSRIAYHYAMVDACIGDTPNASFVNFRFKGGAADPLRKNLRARFLQECLLRHGFSVDVRHDLVNAWLRKYPREEMEHRLDIVGRLMACSRQLDMFMASQDAMRWFVGEFMRGNYRFSVSGVPAGPDGQTTTTISTPPPTTTTPERR
ncbi:MAG: PEP/pyruvate-binding domain-containing protein [Pseudomonadota bacterium]